MQQWRIFLDENIGSDDINNPLRALGHVVVGANDHKKFQNCDDGLLLDYCWENNFVMITENIGDFVKLHRKIQGDGLMHAGILTIDALHLPKRLCAIRRFLESHDPTTVDNAVLHIPSPLPNCPCGCC